MNALTHKMAKIIDNSILILPDKGQFRTRYCLLGIRLHKRIYKKDYTPLAPITYIHPRGEAINEAQNNKSKHYFIVQSVLIS